MGVKSKIFHQNTEDNYTKYNTNFGRIAGATCAIMLSKLAQMFEKFCDELVTHKKYGPNWFYATIDNIQHQTCLTRREQESAIRKLKHMGILEVAVFGTPAKRYFRLNEDKLNEYLGIKIILLDCPNVQNGNNNFTKREEKPAETTQKNCTSMANQPNWFGVDDKLGPYKNIKHKRENIRENTYAPSCDDAEPPAFSPPKIPKTKPKHNVEVTIEEHAKLVEKFGIELVTEGYEDLSEWKESADPKTVAKHKSDYRRLRKWVIPKLMEEQRTADRVKQQAIAPHRRGSKLVTQGDYDLVAPKIKRF